MQIQNDFQRLLVGISNVWATSGITLDLIIHLNKTIDDGKVLNSLRELTAEAERIDFDLREIIGGTCQSCESKS